jgi:hypothetical protein
LEITLQYKYTGHCAHGFVEFKNSKDTVHMPIGVPVEVPEWLATKLAGNSHFVAVNEGVEIATPERKKPGPKPKPKPGEPGFVSTDLSHDAD